MDRRRLLPVLLGFALVVAACAGGDDATTASDGSSADSAATDSAATDSASTDSESSDGDRGSDDGTPFDYSTVDYDAEPAGSALRDDRLDAAFPPPVVDPGDIVSGGPPPDGIPPIDDPIFVTVPEVDFLGDDEGVVVVEIDGDARAYPIQVLIWHEIVNDEIAEVPVTITYCPLCNSALAFDRRFGDRVLDFGTSGELYQSALVMYDRQTESLWAHFTGQGIVGHYAGASLDLVPAQTLGFDTFRELHPDGLVLTSQTGFSRPYGENPYVGYDDAATNPIGGFISQPIDEALAAKDRVVGVIDGDATYAVRLEELAAAGVVAIDGGPDRPLAVLHTGGLSSALETGDVGGGRDVGQTGVFVALDPDGAPLTFSASGDGFVDAETESTWNVAGVAVEGPLAGSELEQVPHLDTFWFSWSTYQPDHELIAVP